MRCNKLFAALCTLAVLFASPAKAAVPQTISYQGRLTDAAGDPAPDVAILVKFMIYDAPVAGTVVWSSGFQPITPVDGLFSYPLGSMVALPDNLFTDTVRYLGITVGTDPELTPREKFRTVSYAYHALRADTAVIAATVFDNSITGAKMALNSVGSSNIVTNGVGPDEIAPNSVGNSEMMDNAIGSAEVMDNSLTAADLGTGSVGTIEVSDNSLTAADLGPNSVNSSEIAAAAVGTSEVADNSLTANDLAANSVGQSEIATNGVGAAEIAANAVGTSEVANNSLTSADLAANSVTSSELATSSVVGGTGGDILDNTITSADIQNSTITGSDIASNSIFDTDLGDEPGVAQITNNLSVTTTVDVPTIINTRVINCPTSGFILAIASFEFGFNHASGGSDTYTLWLSQSTSFPAGQQKNIAWASTMPSAFIRTIVSINHIFAVTAGNQTVNLVADKGVGDPPYIIDDRTLSLVFIPTAYGTVSNPPLPPGENETLTPDSR